MSFSREMPQFRRLLLNAIFVPLVLMLAIAVVLVLQITHLMKQSRDVERADQVISRAYDLYKLTIDMETGLRGFLVTGSDEFLQPFNEALTHIQADHDSLCGLVKDAPKQCALLDQIDDDRGRWLAYARGIMAVRHGGGDYTAVVLGRAGKQQMDRMRVVFDQFISGQRQTRDVESAQAKHSAALTLWLVGVVAVVGGGTLAFLSRSRFLTLVKTYDAALRDVTQLNQTLEDRVRQRTAELELSTGLLTEANKELEAFAYSVSHDLRAPMRHITGFSDLVQKSAGAKLTADENENLQTIHTTARLAGRMVDDLLAFSRVGRANLRADRVDLGSAFETAVKDLAPETKDRRIEWKISPLPAVSADAAMIRLVVTNLLSNAVKYTGKRESAVIEIGTEPGDDPALATVFVRDNGVGFDQNYAGKLFGVFQRLHHAEDFEGTGIGLANVRRIVMRSGGSVRASGKINEGATFWFTLPLADPAPHT